MTNDKGTMTLIEKTVFLKSVDLLASVPTEALAQIAARATEVRCDRGQVLIHEGDENQGAFIVVEGLLELAKGDKVVRVLKPGTAHGEIFLQEHEPHQYTVEAREDSLLLNLRRADVIDALLEYPEFGLAMVHDLSLRHHKLTERLLALETELEECRARGGAPAGTEQALEPIEPAMPARPRRSWWRRAPRPTPSA
jgi:CRP-like cAMP-binding protein